MSCTCNNPYIGDFGHCHIEPINLTEHLRRMLFTEIQIEWIFLSINTVTDNSWWEVESIGEFPLKHDYGFTRNGSCKEGSKYNLLISFVHRDETNKWSGKQRSRLLFIKNE